MAFDQGMTRREFCFVGTAAAFAALGLAGCGGSGDSGKAATGALKDGTYDGRSSTLEAGVDGDGYGIITITVEGGKIVNATFQAYLPDGTPKDKDYGKNTPSYGVAQKVVATGDTYVANLVEAGTIDGVDAESGATFLYDQFKEATEDAMSKAR